MSVTEHYIIIDGNVFDRTTAEGKMAARGYAWVRRSDGDEATYRAIIKLVGKNDG